MYIVIKYEVGEGDLMNLKTARILSILPIVLILLIAGCDASKYPGALVHPALGIVALVSAIITTVNLFLLKK